MRFRMFRLPRLAASPRWLRAYGRIQPGDRLREVVIHVFGDCREFADVRATLATVVEAATDLEMLVISL
jgi:hypothetical protein